jgi:hypothetical protein
MHLVSLVSFHLAGRASDEAKCLYPYTLDDMRHALQIRICLSVIQRKGLGGNWGRACG